MKNYSKKSGYHFYRMKNLVKAVVSEIQTLENCHPDDVAFTNWGTNLEDDDSVSVSDLFPVIGMQEVEDLINMFMIYHPEESVYDSSSRSNKAVFIDFEKWGHTTLPGKFWAILTTSPGVGSPPGKGIIHLPNLTHTWPI